MKLSKDFLLKLIWEKKVASLLLYFSNPDKNKILPHLYVTSKAPDDLSKKIW